MVQELYKKLGENGSYLFCLYDVALEYTYEVRYPDYKDVAFFIENGWLSDDMFVKNPEKILISIIAVNNEKGCSRTTILKTFCMFALCDTK